MSSTTHAFSKEQRQRLVEHARSLKGTAYDFGGRLQSERGIDCQGLIFYALERVHKCGWRSYSVMPQESVTRQELGVPVKGLAPTLTFSFKPDLLQPGDVVYILGPVENPNEKPLIESPMQWVWHMGMATENGQWIHADPYTGAVNEEPLLDFLVNHADSYSGVYVTRLSQKPKPKRCRSRRKKMPTPKAPGRDPG